MQKKKQRIKRSVPLSQLIRKTKRIDVEKTVTKRKKQMKKMCYFIENKNYTQWQWPLRLAHFKHR